MLWPLLPLNSIVNVSNVPPSKPTAVSVSKTAAWSLPNWGSTAQPDFLSPSMAAATGSPFCSNVALGFTSLSCTGAPWPFSGAAVTRKSVRSKLPLAARPGPPFTIDGSASASSRTAVIPLSVVGAVKV